MACYEIKNQFSDNHFSQGVTNKEKAAQGRLIFYLTGNCRGLASKNIVVINFNTLG